MEMLLKLKKISTFGEFHFTKRIVKMISTCSRGFLQNFESVNREQVVFQLLPNASRQFCLHWVELSVSDLLQVCQNCWLPREVLDVTAGRRLTTDSSLPFAKTSTAGLLVAPVPLVGAPEFPAPR
jgi:hypothetical protein